MPITTTPAPAAPAATTGGPISSELFRLEEIKQSGLAYIAGPMTGIKDYNYPAFHDAAARLRARGWLVINPAENYEGRQDLPYETYLRSAFVQVCQAQSVILLDDWEHSGGVAKELVIARALGLPILRYAGGGEVRTLNSLEANYAASLARREEADARAAVQAAEAAEAAKQDEDREALVRAVQRAAQHVEPAPEPAPEPLADQEAAPGETGLQEAQRLVYGDRNRSYGHPHDDYFRTSRLWEVFLGLPAGRIGPRRAALMMALVKVSREAHAHKRDNLVDLAGYAECALRIQRREDGEE